MDPPSSTMTDPPDIIPWLKYHSLIRYKSTCITNDGSTPNYPIIALIPGGFTLINHHHDLPLFNYWWFYPSSTQWNWLFTDVNSVFLNQ